MITLAGLELPEGLLWEDEITGDQPVFSSVRFSLGGAQFIDKLTLQKNKKITLTGGVNHGFMLRGLLLQIKALADSGNTQTLINHDLSTFTVDFRHAEGAIQGDLMRLKQAPDAADLYNNIIIRLRII